MPRFFTDNIDTAAGIGVITGADASHIALSLRMRKGEQVTLCREGTDYICELSDIAPESVTCRILSSEPCAAEPDIRLHLYQAVPKGEKAEIIVQKAVELGVYDITFMLTERCISRPDDKSFSKKLSRYNRIALEASKQSGRGIVPAVYGMVSLAEAAGACDGYDSTVWCYEKGGAKLGALGLAPGTDIGLLIGSEGGFSEGEAEQLSAHGFTPATLGTRIMRCETAPLAAAAIIMYITGNI